MRIHVGLLAGLLGLGGGAVRAGADYYRYETEDGTIAVTDDLKRVPAVYQEKARAIPETSLWDYERITIVSRRPEFGVQAKPASAASAPLVVPVLPPARPLVRVELREGVWLHREVDPEPAVEVEQTHRWVDGSYRPFTIVRQGDEILAERVAR